jgi:hypothetical protein
MIVFIKKKVLQVVLFASIFAHEEDIHWHIAHVIRTTYFLAMAKLSIGVHSIIMLEKSYITS